MLVVRAIAASSVPSTRATIRWRWAASGFALVLLSSAALEAIRLWRLPAALPLAPGGALGDLIGHALSRGIGFNGATLLLLALFAVGHRRCCSACRGSR